MTETDGRLRTSDPGMQVAGYLRETAIDDLYEAAQGQLKNRPVGTGQRSDNRVHSAASAENQPQALLRMGGCICLL